MYLSSAWDKEYGAVLLPSFGMPNTISAHLVILPRLFAGCMAQVTHSVHVHLAVQSSIQGSDVSFVISCTARVTRQDQHLQRALSCVTKRFQRICKADWLEHCQCLKFVNLCFADCFSVNALECPAVPVDKCRCARFDIGLPHLTGSASRTLP